MSALRVDRAAKRLGRTTVLDLVDLAVAERAITAVLGPSGCGKTTLLRLIAGFVRPDAGTVTIGDRLVSGPTVHVPAEHRRVGYVAQEGALFPHLTVAGNVTFGLPRKQRRHDRWVRELLELVELDLAYRDRYPHELSGGQQQRVALARALAPRPSLVLLDEPFAALDAQLRAGTGRAVVDALRASGATGVLVTHDQAEAMSLADRVAVMRAGRILQEGTPEHVYRQPADRDAATFVGASLLLPADARDGHATCALGRVPLDRATIAGPVTLLIRPEQLRLHPASHDIGPRATVRAIEFYGHDADVHLQLDDATPVRARVLGTAVPQLGDRLTVSVEGHAIALDGRGHALRP